MPRSRRRRKTLSVRNALYALLGLGVLGVIGLTLGVRATTIPQPSQVSQAQTTIIYFDDGATEMARLGDANRVNVTIDKIPLITQHAVLAAEDRGFYQHGGFSPQGIARAFWNNLRRSTRQGGSTITQQYAKNAFLTQDQTYVRKVRELLLAIKLETVTSKDKILENYLNAIYFGRGSYGIETAANVYFNKSVADLDLSESAVLAAIIQAPNALSPEDNLDALKERWAYVLDGMVTQGWVTQEERNLASFPEIAKYQRTDTFGGPMGHVIEAVRQALYAQGITEDELNRAGYRVTSTINKQAQDAAIAAVDAEGPKTGTDGLRIGLASVRPGTGEVVAIYGGADYLKDQLNNATQAIGQAGSTFKPFTLAAALEDKKDKVSLSTTFSGQNKTKVDNYVVVNYSGHSYGKKITLLKATMNSVNSAYVQCAKLVGLETVEQSAIRAGIPKDAVGMEPNLAFTLGTASPHVIDIAAAYSTFAARGMRTPPVFVKRVATEAGQTVFEYQAKPVREFSTDVADTVSYALQKVVTGGTGFAAQELGRPAAGKTGTTNDNKSALFAGYTPELATAIMLTKDDANGQPMTLSGTGGMDSVTGGSFPARIWTAYMKAALDGLPATSFPPLPKGQKSGSKPTDSPSAMPTDMPTGGIPSGSPTAVGPLVNAPDFTDQLAADAQRALQELGFVVVLVEQPDNLNAGIVISQDLVGDLPQGSIITLTVGVAVAESPKP